MKKLSLPSRDSVEADLVEALQTYQYDGETKGYEASPTEIAAILSIYDLYDGSLGQSSDALKGAALAEGLIEAVHDAYDLTQKDRKLYRIRQMILAGVEQCPICSIGDPTKLDHFLPQSKYKPLSIYPRNLIPLCENCNLLKGKKVRDSSGARFVHAYFDDVPNVSFLKITLSIDGGLKAKFEIRDDVGLSEELHQNLSHQITKLQLNDRYRREINLAIENIATSIHMNYHSGKADGVRNGLLAQAAHEKRRYHLNHWRPVLYDALAANDEFCNGGFLELFPVAEDILVAQSPPENQSPK